VDAGPASSCGNGIVESGEECDDGAGNLDLYGEPGCSFLCTKAAYCGDGFVQDSAGEQCDLGPANGNWDSPCTNRCDFVLH
jgi:cysteine-rich repeat protein